MNMSHQPSDHNRGRSSGTRPDGPYLRRVSIEDSDLLESMPAGLNKHELDLACARLKMCLDKQLSATPQDWLTYERAVAHCLDLIISFIHENASLEDRRGGKAVMTIMDFIRQANDGQNVQ